MFVRIRTLIWSPIVVCIVHRATATSAQHRPTRKSFECIRFYASRTARNAINFTIAENLRRVTMAANCTVDGAAKVAKCIAVQIVRTSSARSAF